MTFFERTVSAASVAVLFGCGVSVQPVQAAYDLTLTQDGPNVLATGSGTINLAGLTFAFGGAASSLINPPDTGIITGAPGTINAYSPATVPGSFGSGGPSFPSSVAGDLVGTYEGTIYVPSGYISGGTLSDSATYDGATFASLGITPGTYVWTWGSGAHADSFTLVIGAAAVPESSTWAMMLLGFAGLGFAGYRARAAATSNV